MGSGVSHLVGCFIRPRASSSDGGLVLQFSEPLDEGLGHSFCYVRPPPCVMNPEKLGDFALLNGVKNGTASAAADESYLDAADFFSCKNEKLNSQGEKSRSSSVDRPKVPSDKSNPNEKTKIVSETSFKAISGASVSANTATPRSIISCELFNSFSNVLYDRAAAFESTSSFSAIPLQPVPRGFSGPLSGPLDRGFISGPLDRERGFMSGPLERGFMSGPLERGGCMSGPLDAYVGPTHFSAPLNGTYQYSGYLRKRKKSLVRFVRSVSEPMKKALARSASSLARTHRSIVSPVKNYMFSRDRNKEIVGDKDKQEPKPRKGLLDRVDPSVEFSSSELTSRESENLQWAQGKAGEDRVHVVLSEEHGWLFVGIYDGFNGPDAPDFLMSNLYPAIFEELKGLLWDPNEEDSAVPLKDVEEAEKSDEWEVIGANVGEQFYDEKSKFLRDKTLGSDMIQMEKGRRQEAFCKCNAGQNHTGNRTDQVRSRRATPFEVVESQSKDDTRKLSLNSSQSLYTSDMICESTTESQWVSRGVRSEAGASKIWSENTGEHVQENSWQEKASPNVKVEGVEREGRLAVGKQRKQAEDGSSGQDKEVDSERSSDQYGYMEASSLSGKEHRLKRRPTTVVKLRHGPDKRKEQLGEYFQWRYDWDQDKFPGLNRVSNCETAQESKSPGKRKVVDHFSVLEALAKALQTTENAYLDMADKVLHENPELALMGSCVLVMLMKDEDMYILNVGDSRAILAQHPKLPLSLSIGNGGWSRLHGNDSGSRDSLLRLELERIIEETPMELEALEELYENGVVVDATTCAPSLLGALQLTTDHSTNMKEEVLRLRAEHPDDDTIENDRVKGKLKVTRAFGAGFLKQPKWNNALLEMFQINFVGTTPYINCSPALHHHRLGPQDQFLVLSSDGLYQYLSNEEVVSHVEWFMKKFPDGDPAQHLIEELLFRAANKAGMDFHELLEIPHGDRRKYHDDVSVMVISLEGRIWRSSG